METPYRILALEDRVEDFELATREVRKGHADYVLRRVDTERDFLEALRAWEPQLVLCDFTLPTYDGLSALLAAKEENPDLPVIMFTGTLTEETAIQCLRAGADDYILKDNVARLGPAVERALKAGEERRDRRRAEIALKESEARYRDLVESAPDAIVEAGADGRVVLWNSAAVGMFGWKAGEALGMPVFRVIPERSPDNGRSGAGDWQDPFGHLRGDRSPGRTVMASRKDGTEFPAEISVSSSTEGGAEVFTAVIRDVTERVLAQRAIETLSREYELLLSSAGEGILGLDRDGAVSYANPAAVSLLRLEVGDLLGKNLHPIIHDGVVDEEECPILKSLRDGSSYRGELEFRRADGTRFFSATSLTPLVENGISSGAVMIMEDVTIRKEQEDALRASEERFRGLVEHATYGIYQSTAEGTFRAVNPALVELLGYDSAESLLAVDIRRDLYLDSADRDRLVESFKAADTVVGAEATWLKKDGTPVSVRLSGRGIWGEDGSFDAFEVFVEDLTDRKMLEDQLRQAQKMEAVGQLTGGIAHDFNNVLSVILLNSELMIAALEAGEAGQIEDIRAIHDSAQRAASITRKLLGFSRKAELVMEPSRLDEVVGGMSGMLRTLLPENIRLTMKVPEEVEQVLADPGSIEQILLNLVGNSRDALPEGGTVTVGVSAAELDETYTSVHPYVVPGRFVCIEVSDDGVGMDKDTLSRVFDPFFTTKSLGMGTGLGMAMVYGLTKQQGGHVTVYSEPGIGTTTRLYFPCREGESSPLVEAPMEDTAEDRPATILLVEDEENLKTATTRVLEARGYTILTASDGAEALQIFRERRESIDLVISDLVLPKLGGLELLKALQKEYGPIRFILTSGYSTQGLEGFGPNATRIPFLRKPWVLNGLLTVIRTALDSEIPLMEDGHVQHSDH